MTRRIALLDGDVIAYKAAVVATETIDWDGDGETSGTVNVAKSQGVFHQMVKSWTKAAGCKRARVLFSDRASRSFRYRVHPEYKAQRDPSQKPDCLEAVEEWAFDRFDGDCWPGLEGDDALGLEATADPGRYVIVSTDKDMRTIPGRCLIVPHQKPLKFAKVENLSEDQADFHWWFQVITGDTIDNYKGAPGAGPARARDVLAWSNPRRYFEDVLTVYEEQFEHPKWGERFHHEDPLSELLMNARCARILRDGEYDHTENRVRLWTHDGTEKWMQI